MGHAHPKPGHRYLFAEPVRPRTSVLREPARAPFKCTARRRQTTCVWWKGASERVMRGERKAGYSATQVRHMNADATGVSVRHTVLVRVLAWSRWRRTGRPFAKRLNLSSTWLKRLKARAHF